MDVRCCCAPENLLGDLPPGLPYRSRELDDGTFAYVSDGLPYSLLVVAQANLALHNMTSPQRRKGRRKTWRKKVAA